MPQLMPLMWISSNFMIFLLVFVYLNMYYEKMDGVVEIGVKSYSSEYNFMKW